MRSLIRSTLGAFTGRGGRSLAGAIAFYAMLSVAPLLVIALQIAGALTGASAARAALLDDLTGWVGKDGAATIIALVDRVHRPGAGWHSLLPIAVMLYASTRLFSQLKRALDQVWAVSPPHAAGLRDKVRAQLGKRLTSFLLVLGVGLVLVALVAVRAGYAHAASALGGDRPLAWRITETGSSVAIAALLFAVLFKVLPHASIPWREALLGGLITAALFTAGSSVVGAYLSHRDVAARYGEAGSVVVLLLWVHYSSQVFLLGAAFTGEWAREHGHLPAATPAREDAA